MISKIKVNTTHLFLSSISFVVALVLSIFSFIGFGGQKVSNNSSGVVHADVQQSVGSSGPGDPCPSDPGCT